MEKKERFLPIKVLIAPWRVIPSLVRVGKLTESLLATVVAGITFASIELLRAHLTGFWLDLSMVRWLYVGGVTLYIVGWCVLSLLSYFVALLLLRPITGPSIDVAPFLRVSGYAAFPFAFWNLQWIGWIIPIYGICLWILASKHGFECDLDRAVMISIPTIVVYLFLVLVWPFFPGMVPISPVGVD